MLIAYFSIPEGGVNTVPLAYQVLAGATISCVSGQMLVTTDGLSDEEKNRISTGDTFLVIISSVPYLLVVASYAPNTGSITLQQPYTGATFTDEAAWYSKGPLQRGYPREWSIKGSEYKIDKLTTYEGVLAYPYNNMKEPVRLVQSISGEVTVADAIQSYLQVNISSGGI